MKKGALIFAILFVISIFAFAGALAAGTVNVSQAYTCLENQINQTKCSRMSIEEQVFSLLSTGQCEGELINNSLNKQSECWPGNVGGLSCNLQMTAEAVYALNSVGANTTAAENWLTNDTGVSTDLNWFLEVANTSVGSQSCSVSYAANMNDPNSTVTYPFFLNSDGTINSSAGSCLSLASGGYWFSIDPSCYDRVFGVECNGSFITTMMYQNKNSQTYNILPYSQGATGSSTYEQVNSFCFMNPGSSSCNYLGSLWASMTLNAAGKDVSKFVPYLSTLASSNVGSFPAVFLYAITGNPEYETSVLGDQMQIKVTTPSQYYWDLTGKGKYYDTALALLPFQADSNLQEKTDTESWLASTQQPNGCWDNNQIVTNGFLLYSLWPNQYNGSTLSCSDLNYNCVSDASSCTGTVENQYTCSSGGVCCAPGSGGTTTNLCTQNGDSCVSASQCASDSIVGQYSSSCGGGYTTVCCSSVIQQQTCGEQQGNICQSNQYCSGGSPLQGLPGMTSGQTCCLEPGICTNQTSGNTGGTTSTCEANSGLCQASCPSGYSATSAYTCSSSSDLCCTINANPTPSGGTSYWWIWVLFILVVIAVVALLYRDKIKEFLQKRQARRGGKGRAGPGTGGLPPRFPPPYNRSPQMSPPPRRMLPPSRPVERPPQRPPQRSPEELNDVLKKLKEIGK